MPEAPHLQRPRPAARSSSCTSSAASESCRLRRTSPSTSRPARFVGIAGRSGSGKSSLLKCIYRTYLRTAGSLLYRSADGATVDLVDRRRRPILELRGGEIGYVSQFLRPDAARPRPRPRRPTAPAARRPAGRGARAGRRAVRPPGAAARPLGRLPDPVQRRRAAAGQPRPGAGRRAAPAAAGRADLGARRVAPGAGRRAAGRGRRAGHDHDRRDARHRPPGGACGHRHHDGQRPHRRPIAPRHGMATGVPGHS